MVPFTHLNEKKYSSKQKKTFCLANVLTSTQYEVNLRFDIKKTFPKVLNAFFSDFNFFKII